MGSIILQAADMRRLMPHAHIMFHLGSPTPTGNNIHETLNAANYEKEYGDKLDMVLFQKIRNVKKISWKKFQEMNFKGRYLHAEEAVALGLADEVVRK